MRKTQSVSVLGMLLAVFLALQPGTALALDVKQSEQASLSAREFFKPELRLSSNNVPASAVLDGLANKEPWAHFLAAYGHPTVFFDPRSGIPSNVILSVPMLPGTGQGNTLENTDLGASLGRKVDEIDEKLVGDLILKFVVSNREAFGIDSTQLGPVRAKMAAEHLWHVTIPQYVDGIPVRHGRIAAVINHGNLVMLGADTWGNVNLDTQPKITAPQALSLGFAYVGGKDRRDELWRKPELEIIPVAPAEFQSADAFIGPVGSGYRHRLVWSFGFQRKDEVPRWELLVDAHTGEVIAFEDKNLYESKQVTGTIYPLTSTEICPSNDRCGVAQPNTPMSFADTGLPAPNNFANSAGLFDYPGSGTVTTQLNGKYVKIIDNCGAVNESGSGDILLGGLNGQHDCTSAGTSAGDTPASRSAFFEVNKLMEQARGWLPGNTWLQAQLQTTVNITSTCNAFYSAGTINFYRSGGGCRNTGEIAAVFDHEWGHALDDFDTGGSLSVTSEAYADIAAIYRLQASCVGYGFLWTLDRGCGMTADGTGFNYNESRTGTHCILDCSGVRDADWNKHADHVPDTPANYSCIHCDGGSGPCGKQVHCDAAPTRQAAWDFVARDLTAAPFNMELNDAFTVGNKLFYQGSGLIGSWHACTCPSTSNGCGATNGYMQWLAADDDDGNVANGTPHMTALFAAFNRHAIACDTPAPVNSGCASGPTAAPTLSVSVGSNQLSLSWTPVPGAVTYRVLRSEGYAGCDFGKAVIAEVAGTSYNDPSVANGRDYHYVVQAVGTSGACYGPGSACVTSTPQPCAASIGLTRNLYNCSGGTPLDITVVDGDLVGQGFQSARVSSTSEPGPETTMLVENPPNSGIFKGTFNTTGGPATPGDGAISVSNGDTITVAVTDVSYCGVPNVNVSRTADVDCVGPVISNVRSENVTGNSADIKWDTGEASNSQVSYGLAVPPGTTTPVAPAFVTGHTVRLNGLLECKNYFFGVSSSDPAANTAFADNGGAYFSFETGKNVNPTYPSPSPPVAIPDNTTVLATVNVPDVNTVLDVNVKVNITHTYDGDLKLSLVGPDGTTVVLSNRRGSGGDNFNDTIFDDEAATPISGGSAPFAGSYRPDEPLSAFDGKASAGVWTLQVADMAGADTGTLNAFDLIVTYPAQACGPALKYKSHTSVDVCNGTGAGGGNGLVEPGETVTIPVVLENNGTAPTTGVSAGLSSPTPGVTILTGASAYPDLAAGQSALGVTPFVIQVDPSVPCGTIIQLNVGCAANEGAWNGGSFTIPVGSLSGTQTFTVVSTDVPVSLPDPGTVTSQLSVASTETVLDVNVSLTLTHTYTPDLVLTLISPGGTRVKLSDQRPRTFSTTPQNYTGTTFDDESASPISSGAAPFSGSFRPETPLSAVDGTVAGGTWRLEIQDLFPIDTGSLSAWSITFFITAPPTCNVCTIAPPTPGEVISLMWSGTSRDTLEWGSAPGAASYRLYRGESADLPLLLDASTDSCERLETAGLSSGAILTEIPAQRTFHWFLVRGANGAGQGPAGNATAGPRSQESAGICQ